MKRLGSKLKSGGGEALAETLAALLIAALALTMLAAAISSTGKILQNSQRKLEVYYRENDKLSAQEEGDAEADAIRIVLMLSSPAAGQGNYTGGEVFLTGDRRAEARYYVNDTLGEEKKVIAYCLRRTGG